MHARKANPTPSVSAAPAVTAMSVSGLLGTGPSEVTVSSLAYDSRRVEPGGLFFCISGYEQDGHAYAAEAVERGAAALVVERPLGLGVPEVVVLSARRAMAQAAARFAGHPSAELDVIGVTGTNGKTTTVFMIQQLLEAAGRPCSLIGTVGAVIGGREREMARTTPEAIELQHAFREMLDAGDEACAIEVSSHALALNRIDGTRFAATVFTNLSRDHLDFHGTIEDYFVIKRRLFDLDSGAAVINIDDQHGRRLAAELEQRVTFAIDRAADYRAVGIHFSPSGSDFTIIGPDTEISVRCPLFGRFNVLNILAAVAAARTLGAGAQEISRALVELAPIPGRLEPVDAGQGFAVFVDFAHSPAALREALAAVREITAGRVLCVFGCAGGRDPGARPLMGHVAADAADRALATTDNPASEDPQAIIDEIMGGAGPNVEAILDRRQAIERVIDLAGPDDTVLIAGRGHEQEQVFPDGHRVPFDDVTVASQLLRGAAPSQRE